MTTTTSKGAIWTMATRLAPAAIAAKNTKASATPISLGLPIAGSILPRGDADLYRFDAPLFFAKRRRCILGRLLRDRAEYEDAIRDLYVDMDKLVGRVMDAARDDDVVMVMSDHGFGSWRRVFHLNNWLEENGYLVLKDPNRRTPGLYRAVDWSRTRAYGLGFNGLYLNLAGREGQGIVPADQIDVLDPQPDETILDLGCGSGDLLASLRPSQGVGIDISAPATMIAQSICFTSPSASSAESIGGASNSITSGVGWCDVGILWWA